MIELEFFKRTKWVKSLIDSRDGIQPHQYDEMDEFIKHAGGQVINNGIDNETLNEIHKELKEVFLTKETMMGFIVLRPHGYSGDFEILERIYNKYNSSNPRLATWDKYFHQQIAPQAVRNRKEFFKNIFNSKIQASENLEILNLASGSGRDMLEAFEANPNRDDFSIDCIDMDKNAISYARELLKNHASKVNFILQNVFKFVPTKKYDLIWSAGLFDYFDDKTFVGVLHNLIKYVKPNGEVILGNFHPRNPTVYMMEFGYWKLHHRTNEHLLTLAQKAGAKNIKIEQEQTGINLFLRISI